MNSILHLFHTLPTDTMRLCDYNTHLDVVTQAFSAYRSLMLCKIVNL